MTDIKSKVQGMDANLCARNVEGMAKKSSSIYETIAVINKRARQLSNNIKEELHQKLEEFATHTDTIEEIHENKEQIEISKFYERIPNPALIATNEFLDNELEFEYKEVEEEEEDEETATK